MPELIWSRGDATTTTARLIARSDTSGVLSVVCNGGTHTGDTVVADATNDGWGTVDITGLSANTAYPFSLRLDGTELETGTVKTFPSSGRYKVGFATCTNHSKDAAPGYQVMEHSPEAFFLYGDCIYSMATPGATQPSWGETLVDSGTDNATAIDPDTYFGHHRHIYKTPGVKRLQHNANMFKTMDDHDYPGSNWDNSTAACNDLSSGTPCGDAGETAAVKAVCESVADLVYAGNPDNTDEGIDADAVNMYYRKTIGDCEFFVLNCVRYRDDVATHSTMLGANQKAWLKSNLASSTAIFKCIVSPKVTYHGGSDGWNVWDTERDELLDYIEAASGWAVPGGVFWCAGDVHIAMVISQYKTASDNPAGVGGASRDHACFVAGTMSSGIVNGHAPTDNLLYSQFPEGVGLGSNKNCYGVLDIGPDYVEAILYETTGKLLWKGRVLPGENKIDNPAIPVKI